MPTTTVRIEMTGRISRHAANTLGGWVEDGDEGSVLVAPYIDQAQLTGLLVQLSELHLDFHHVAVQSAADTVPTALTTRRNQPMTTSTATNPTDLAIGRVKRLGVAALATAALAVVAGLALLAIDPADGSAVEGGLGFIAASSGLSTAGLAIGAVVYAQAKGLWTRFPITGRGVLWAFIAVGIARTVWSQVSHLA